MLHRLEGRAATLSMAERLLQAAVRLEQSAPPDELRRDQRGVFAAAATYLIDVATRPGGAPPFGRIVQPPRTGKTVIAAHLVARAGLTATFVVPTRALVDQTVRELRARLPGVPVGVYTGERKRAVRHGVNVTTYPMLARAWASGRLPPTLARSGLVFVDEAHHAMTAARMELLHGAFDPLAVRLGLTATPDYGAARRLEHHFSDLVHEISLVEAMALDLLAPLRVWVAEVDVDASTVRIVGGDYEPQALGKLMSAGPFYKAVELFRYGHGNAGVPALVACASRRQAHDLVRYLERHRPAGHPAPRLLLGDTPAGARRRALALFERGRIDTLVQVGVLVEGWSSARCKLLVDLAASTSLVRATQKYARVMTPDGGAEARIYVVLPKRLPGTPVLPMDVFGWTDDEYRCGERVGPRGGTGPARPAARPTGPSPIEGVDLIHRVLYRTRVDRPALDPRRAADVRDVLASNRDFAPPRACALETFVGLQFEHRLFAGRGDFLLRWLGVPRRRDAYAALLASLFREDSRAPLDDGEEPRPCCEDLEHVEAALEIELAKGCRAQAPWSAWWALGGHLLETPPATPETAALAREEAALRRVALAAVQPRRVRLLMAHFGLDGGGERTFDELGIEEGISRGRVGQLIEDGLRRLAHAYKALRRGWEGDPRFDPEAWLAARRPPGSLARCPLPRRGAGR